MGRGSPLSRSCCRFWTSNPHASRAGPLRISPRSVHSTWHGRTGVETKSHFRDTESGRECLGGGIMERDAVAPERAAGGEEPLS
jgi:hypothetical protein